jgi:predicted transcriptional regulator
METYLKIYQMPQKQKDVLLAIAKDGKAKNVTSGSFIRAHHLSSASSVRSGINGLLEKDFITNENGTYQVYDKFFEMWIQRTIISAY